MKQKIKILSNFNTDNLHNFLKNDFDRNKFSIEISPYGQFFQKIFKYINSKKTNDICIVWSQAEYTFKNFNQILNYEKISYKELKKEINQFVQLIKKLSYKSERIIIFSWNEPRYERGRYLNDYSHEAGITNNLNFINSYVAKSLSSHKNIHFINSNMFLSNDHEDYNPKLWYAAKIPYDQNVFKKASLELKQIINHIYEPKIKLIILDLDNTLWGGVLGDLGWEKIKIGGHSITGESFLHFQRKLKALNNLGVQLAISSKNNEEVALGAIKKNYNMILKKENFSTWRINWKNKAENIKEIIRELNLLNENVIFIDDNPSERARVKSSIKGINVPDWPTDPTHYVQELHRINKFDFSSIVTKEDLKRTEYYKDNLARQKNRQILSEEQWLKTLNTKVYFKKVNNENKDRVLQLINRTNQMNLSTNRISESNLNSMIKKSNLFLYCCSVEDKFGEMGIVGFFNLEIKKKGGYIKDFLLSCRAFGRGIEESMIYKNTLLLNSKKIKYLELKYKKTTKNNPCLVFLSKNFKNNKNIFFLKKVKEFKKPRALKIY